jgi:hypothetical protein
MNEENKYFDFNLKIPRDKLDSVQLTLDLEIFATLKTVQAQLSELIAHQKGLDIKETVLRHNKLYDELGTTRIVEFLKQVDK